MGVVLTVLSFAFMGNVVKTAPGPGSALAQTVPGGTGMIRGRVVDARSGRPIAGATVELSNNGLTASALTDDDGRYEIGGLQEGEWNVLVQISGYVAAQFGQRNTGEVGRSINVRAGQVSSAIDVGLQAAGVVSGRVFSDAGEGLTGVEVQVLAERYLPGGAVPVPVGFAQTEASGVFRVGDLQPGTYYVRAYVPPTVRPSRADGTKVYALSYFPGVARVDEAQPIVVNEGRELFAVDFALATVVTHTVSGALVDPSGGGFDQAQVTLMSGEGNSSAFSQTVPVSPDGRFLFRNVVPGNYVLTVGQRAKTIRWMAASRPISIDRDLSDVRIVARPGGTVEGRIVRDGGASLPFDPRSVRLQIQRRIENGPVVRQESGPGVWVSGWGGNVRADGTFSIETPGGVSSLQVSGLPPNWMVKAIRLEGFDIADQATDFGDGGRRDLEIVLTNRVANVAGTVTDRNGRILSNYTVVVFPENRDRWNPPSRLVRGVRPLQDGLFRIEALPAADYLVIAVESLPQNAWSDPNVLDRLYPLATRFRLGEGEQRTLQLKLSPTPEGLLAERELRKVLKSLSVRRESHQ